MRSVGKVEVPYAFLAAPSAESAITAKFHPLPLNHCDGGALALPGFEPAETVPTSQPSGALPCSCRDSLWRRWAFHDSQSGLAPTASVRPPDGSMVSGRPSNP